MIKDSLENINRYSVNKDFEAFKTMINKKEDDPIELPSTIKAVNLNYETREFDYSTFENHLKNIDIHVMLKGEEKIALNKINNLKAISEYNEEKDYQLFEGAAVEEVALQEGEFLILFPGEVHITGGRLNQNRIVTKKVYKLPMV